MNVLEKLESRSKELDMQIKRSLLNPPYAFQASEDRELLDLTMRYIRALQQQLEQYDAFAR